MNEMQVKIIELIENEERRSPYKDSDLAEIFHVERGYVTQLRKKSQIPDSRNRLRKYLQSEIEEIIDEAKTDDMKAINDQLISRGFEVSRYLLKGIIESLESNENHIPTKVEEKEQDAFEGIIGHDGSLKNVVKLSRAAIMYPPNGLNTIIYGESGVGKNLLVSSMYKYALQTGLLKNDAQLVIFNCADYADNPQLLLSILFGVKQGAYTGAQENRDGLLSRANKGILFLDEIHRMPPKGQEILFQMLDTGTYRRLGESDKDRKIETLLICATTEKPENCLLNTFLRRIPMAITIPSLKERPISERMDLMEYYLKEQISRLKMDIEISRDATKALLLYEPNGNIGKFFNDIQVSLAKGYLMSLSEEAGILKIELNDLPYDIQKGIMNGYQQRESIEKLIGKGNFHLEYGGLKEREYIDSVNHHEGDTVYEFIDSRFKELKISELNYDDINSIISNEIEKKIALKVNVDKKKMEKGSIVKIIGLEMTSVIEQALNSIMEEPVALDGQFFFAIAFHINETIKRIKNNMQIINPRLIKVRQEYPDYYSKAIQITSYLASELNMMIPEEEAAYIAMYLYNYQYKNLKSQIGILIVTHGKIASNLMRLSNAFMEYDNIQALEMDLDDHPEVMLKKSMEMVKEMDQGRGVLMLIDMGSLETFGPVIEDITQVPVRTISRVEIVTLLEAIRIAQRDEIEIDEVYQNLKMVQLSPISPHVSNKKDMKSAIVTTCFTGQGSAKYLKDLLDHTLENMTVDIIPMGVLANENTLQFLEKIQSKYNIICSIGTINPKIPNTPYISMKEVFEGNIYQRISEFYNRKNPEQPNPFNDSMVLANKECRDKSSFIEFICNALVENNLVSNDYEADILERESIGPTCLRDAADRGVVVLHSMTGQNVLEDTLGIVTLRKPIDWGYMEVDVIIVAALKHASMELMELINRNVINNEKSMNLIRSATSNDDLANIMKKAINEGEQ